MLSRTTSGGGEEVVLSQLPPRAVVHDRMLLASTHQSSLRTRATFSWPILYKVSEPPSATQRITERSADVKMFLELKCYIYEFLNTATHELCYFAP